MQDAGIARAVLGAMAAGLASQIFAGAQGLDLLQAMFSGATQGYYLGGREAQTTVEEQASLEPSTELSDLEGTADKDERLSELCLEDAEEASEHDAIFWMWPNWI